MALVKRKAIQHAAAASRSRSKAAWSLPLAWRMRILELAATRRGICSTAPCGRRAGQRLRREPDTAVREVILTTLVRLNDPSATGEMAECLRSEDAALRNEVIESIGLMPCDVSHVLRSLLADADPDVRIFAVNILDTRRQPDVESWLIDVIERDAHLNVCATAVDVLCEAGSESSVEPLLRLKDRFRSDASSSLPPTGR